MAEKFNAIEWTKRKTSDYRTHYRQKAYDTFVNKYHFDSLTNDENEFIFDQFWFVGKVCNFQFGNKEANAFIFADFGISSWNRYHKPASISPRAQWTAEVYPNNLAVDDKATICFIRQDQLPIWRLVEPMVEDIVDASMALKIHELFLKLPLFFKSTPELEEKMYKILKNLIRGVPCIGITGAEIENFESLNGLIDFHLPEIRQHLTECENKLKDFLGIDNAPQMDFDRMNVDQTNANNAELNASNDIMFNRIKEWNERSIAALGFDMKPVVRIKPITSFHDDVDEEGDKEDEA